MTAIMFRAMTMALALAGLSGRIEARSEPNAGYAPPPVAEASAHHAPTSPYLDQSSMLIPLVWRSDKDPAARIDVARRHHHHSHRSHDDKVAASQPAQTVVVRKGDTINAIAKRLHTTPKAVMDANPGLRPRYLKIGDELRAPGAETPAAGERGRHARGGDRERQSNPQTPKTYMVKHGDTLYSIGRRFGVSVDDLKALNKLRSVSRVRAGQKLILSGEPEAATGEERAARTARRPSAAPPAREGSMSGQAGVAPAQPVPYASLPGEHPAPPPTYSTPSTPPTPAPSAPTTEAAPAAPTDAQVAEAGRGRFAWPAAGDILSGFGSKPGGQRNDGLDIAAPDGAPVHAAAAGDVVYAGNLVPGFGNLVLIKHEDGWVTAYAHLSKTEVKIKDHIAQGAEIGTVGSSGGVDQPQLHFEVRYAPSPRERARPIDPALVLPTR